ncbi:HNH endonuclease family protein [Bdellovibrio bacteriovorus]|uniref:HNH endonuclease n=1 Tax=Bdellovibrio bacteriovorus TaxID=959 RepID=A0A1Z3N8V7_BDEBC|nr:HNH endonuclease family protein [Bdellovibrio bacteriovorus]ASD63886.1 HNH endonuclease [Bdellovibrio bacteriovorus]
MKHLKLKTVSLQFVTMAMVAMSAAPVYAAPATAAPAHEFFTVDEDNLESDTTRRNEYSFMEYSPEFGPQQFIQGLKKVVINLLKWTLHEEAPPAPEEKYMRKLHFGRWINDPTDDTCMNTRAKVLVRDSNQEVTYRGNRQCVVDAGHWNDPYAGKEVVVAKEIQIDHMVPLKNAYISGAWQWDYKTRCLYANYMGYKNHLIAADASANMSKGDRAPDKYLPSNLAYRCQYVRDWLAVKLIWKLNMTMDEVQAIHDVVTNYGCKASDFKFSKAELESQREYINGNLDFCMINKR